MKEGFCTCAVTCDLCHAQWIAVYPSVTENLECPQCKNITTFSIVKDYIKEARENNSPYIPIQNPHGYVQYSPTRECAIYIKKFDMQFEPILN